MVIEARRDRERAARRRLIVATARRLAEAEGWEAVTTRRLSAEIEYSQPVLYKHFTGLEQIAEAVAIDGFGELGDATRAARLSAGSAGNAAPSEKPAWLKQISGLASVGPALARIGFSAEEVEKITSGNWLRLYRATIG